MSTPPDTLSHDAIVPLPPLARVDRRYSRFVGLAKRVLPGFAVLLLLLVAIWPHMQTEIAHVHFTLPRLDPREAQDLRMVNARYTGIDRDGRPFVVTADVA